MKKIAMLIAFLLVLSFGNYNAVGVVVVNKNNPIKVDSTFMSEVMNMKRDKWGKRKKIKLYAFPYIWEDLVSYKNPKLQEKWKKSKNHPIINYSTTEILYLIKQNKYAMGIIYNQNNLDEYKVVCVINHLYEFKCK